MKWAALILLIFCHISVAQAQACDFDYYPKKGGHYLFSTYYEKDNKTPRTGNCEHNIGTQRYTLRSFDKGHITLEELNYYNDGKFTPHIRTQLNHSTKKGQDLGYNKVYDEKGNLIHHFQFYTDKTGRRCERETEYLPTGKLRFIREFAFIRLSEIDSFHLNEHPPHTVDDFGYTSLQVPYGVIRWYNDQGQLIREEHYDQLTFYRQDAEHLLHGKFTEFHDNGKLKTQGQFKEGNPDGSWRYFHFNGRVYEQGIYRNNIKDSLWQQWDDQGKLTKESLYDYSADNPFAPVREKEYNALGLLVKSKEVNTEKQAILQEWSPQGKLMRYVRYSTGMQMNWNNTDYREFEKTWYDNGQVKSIHNKRSDTSYVSYFKNGQMERLNLGHWYDALRKEEKTEWNIQGTRLLYIEITHGNGNNYQDVKRYYSNGNLSHREINNNKEHTDLRYSFDGKNYVKSRMVNQQLQGRYEERDTLNGQFLVGHYDQGIRHGLWELKTKDSVILEKLTYDHGCVQAQTAWGYTTEDEKITWQRRANYIIYHQNQAPWENMKDCIAYRDSLAHWMRLLNQTLVKNGVNPDFGQLEFQALHFELPHVYYRNLIEDGIKEYRAEQLLHLIDSLGWKWKAIQLSNGTYIGTIEFTGILNPAMQVKLLGEHSHFFYPVFTATDDPDGTMYPRSWGSPPPSAVVIQSMNPCYATVQYSEKGRSTHVVVYSNGAVEILNRTISWEAWKKLQEEPSPYDRNFYWKD
jgi:antitoxin component YwqK of YwqJK toxin-antitoxin module